MLRGSGYEKDIPLDELALCDTLAYVGEFEPLESAAGGGCVEGQSAG